MKIISIDARSSLEMMLNTYDDYRSLTFKVRVDIGHGDFLATNSDVHFQNLPRFQDQLSQFISDRTLKPRADGTYHSFVEVYGNAAHTYVGFRVGDSFCGSETSHFSLSGSFEFEQDHLSRIVREIEEIQYDP